MSDLALPDFLRDAPRRPMPKVRKWKKMVARRPEGEKWAEAERWEITVPASWSDRGAGTTTAAFGSGRRRVWVVQGTKWAYIRDAEAHIKVPVSEWAQVARKGRVVS